MDVPLQFVGISWVIEGADNIDSSDMLLAIGFMGVSRLSSGDDGPSDRYVQVMNLTIWYYSYGGFHKWRSPKMDGLYCKIMQNPSVDGWFGTCAWLSQNP